MSMSMSMSMSMFNHTIVGRTGGQSGSRAPSSSD